METVEPALGLDPRVNVMVETVFDTIKSELAWTISVLSLRHVEIAIGRDIDGSGQSDAALSRAPMQFTDRTRSRRGDNRATVCLLPTDQQSEI